MVQFEKNVVERKTRDVINPEANEDVCKLCALSVNQQAVV